MLFHFCLSLNRHKYSGSLKWVKKFSFHRLELAKNPFDYILKDSDISLKHWKNFMIS